MANIELPICKGSYSSDPTNEFTDSSFLDGVMQAIETQAREYRPFFVGLCYNCYVPGTLYPLQRCSGCQLVSYCSRECQKEDRFRHKYVCKEFPMVDGKNVLNTKGSWKKHIVRLRERAAQIPNAKPIFRNPRVCNTCKTARQDHLENCICACVSYCSKKCSNADKHHENECTPLLRISQYRVTDFPLILPLLGDITKCETFTPTTTWTDFIPPHYISLMHDLIAKEGQVTVALEMYLVRERFSYPMSLLYALQSLPERRLNSDSRSLEDLTTLNVHVITSIPLFDSESWEVFMHRLPKLRQLNIVFILQGRSFRQSFSLLSSMMYNRCNDCADKDRVMTYSVQQMLYHMFFSTLEYTEPDVVVVYGNGHEMSEVGEDGIHSEISYRNMTQSRDTVLVLMDATKDLVRHGARAVDAAQPVDQLVPVQANPLCGFSTNRAEMDSNPSIINEKAYYTCLRRK